MFKQNPPYSSFSQNVINFHLAIQSSEPYDYESFVVISPKLQPYLQGRIFFIILPAYVLEFLRPPDVFSLTNGLITLRIAREY